MQLTKIIITAIACSFLLTACDQTERQKSAGEKIKGSAQESVGNLTNDPELKAKGKGNKLKGDLRSTKEDVKDAITGE